MSKSCWRLPDFSEDDTHRFVLECLRGVDDIEDDVELDERKYSDLKKCEHLIFAFSSDSAKSGHPRTNLQNMAGCPNLLTRNPSTNEVTLSYPRASYFDKPTTLYVSMNYAEPDLWFKHVIFLTVLAGRGSTGCVWRGQYRNWKRSSEKLAVVVKISNMTEERKLLRHEASMYDRHLRRLQGTYIPRIYGCFEQTEFTALVMEDCGDTILGQLLHVHGRHLYECLQKIHGLGVLHGDLKQDNLVCGRHGARVIDFSHASTGHCCSGPDSCEERRTARWLLGSENIDLQL